MKTLLLVDGSSYLYRAFHALPDLRNREGEPTGAIYGVINMLRRLRAEVAPDYSACVFDAKGKTFRDDWYPQYKAQRPPMPADLVRQIEPLHACIAALGWPILMIEGVEADDVIGTLAKRSREDGIRCVISTGDKDLAQLVEDGIELVNTLTNERLDVAGVQAKFGVPPERIVDYFSLVGDAVDNVPGVEKVGPKTAVKWLSQYGTLDAVLTHSHEIGGAVGENLRKAHDWLPLARKLLTIKCDVPIDRAPSEFGFSPPEVVILKSMFERFGFRSWVREFESAAPMAQAGSPAASPGLASAAALGAYETILDEPELERWIERLGASELFAIDTETTSLDPMAARIVGISFACERHRAAYLPLDHRYPGAPAQIGVDRALALLKPIIEDPRPAKLGQNIKYDSHVFANHGVALRGVVHDTLLQSYVLESHKPHDMDSLAERHLELRTIHYQDVAGKGAAQIGFDQVGIGEAARYSAEDSDVTLQLHHALFPKIAADAKLDFIYRRIEIPLIEILLRIERNGVLLDVEALRRQSGELGVRLLELERNAHAAAGGAFNLNSTKQIQEILFQRQKLPVLKKTPGGAPSTDEDVLERLALDYPLPKLLLDFRTLAKLKSTYTDKLPLAVNAHTGRVHTNYAQAVAATGRLSSVDPNLQNIPVRSAEGRRIREAFVAPPGACIVSADYSQIELRIMAHISKDANLLKAFAEGTDVHRATAAEIFGVAPDELSSEQRRYAKAINFGLIYGMSAFGLAAQLGIERGAAQAYIDRYFARYPGVAAYMQRTREAARTDGFVETVFGRRLWLSEIRSANAARRQGAERAAINAPMQGTAADLIKLAMIAVHGWLEHQALATKLIMQVHDELVFEVPEAELALLKAELPKLMVGVAELEVPLAVDIGAGPNWESAH